jgi:ADP-heptose:LPS heptosyltransferase
MWRVDVRPVDIRHCKVLVLLGLDGKLGDAVLQSALVREIADAAPSCRILVATTRAISSYWQSCAGVAGVFIVPSRSEASTRARLSALRALSRIPELSAVDVALAFDPIPMLDYFCFIRWLMPRVAIGLSVLQYELFDISIVDPILEVPRKHAGERIVRVLSALGVTRTLADLSSLVPPSTQAALAMDKPGPAMRRIFLNGFGASPTRTFSCSQLVEVSRSLLAMDPGICVVINASADQRGNPDLRRLLGEHADRLSLFQSDGTVCALFDAVAACGAVLTPDTGVAHVAAAVQVPVVVAFDDVDFNPVCWHPLGRRVICLVQDQPQGISRIDVGRLVQGLEASLALA